MASDHQNPSVHSDATYYISSVYNFFFKGQIACPVRRGGSGESSHCFSEVIGASQYLLLLACSISAVFSFVKQKIHSRLGMDLKMSIQKGIKPLLLFR